MKRILVVEDDVIILEDLKRTLSSLGYSVPHTAQTGDEAVLAALELKPDLILMDIKLRGKLDGIETAALVRKQLDVPILYLTSHSDERTLARAKETAPQGYVLKPFNERDLRVAVEVALRKHELETRLAQRERWFSTTLESIGDAVIASDPKGQVAFMNSVAEALTGRQREVARGKPVEQICRLSDAQGNATPIASSTAASERAPSPLPAHLRLIDASGASVEIEGSSAPIIDDRGRLLGRVMVFRDVTERRKLEQKLAHAERMASIGTLAAGTAHEINNPLAALIGNVDIAVERLQLMRKDLTTAQQSSKLPVEIDQIVEALGDAHRSGERVRNIIQDLSKFGRTDHVETEVLELPVVIEAALGLTEHQIRLKAGLVRQYGVTPRVEANEGRLVQVFTNLLVNAAQAIDEGHAATNLVRIVTYTDERGRAVFEVHDSGRGIRPESLPRIFDPFFTTKDIGSGMGLGLSICHGIVTGLGGEISVSTEVGAGSTFRVVLPPATGSPTARRQARPAAVSARPGRVLVVDDEPVVSRIMERALSAEHEVVTENDARAAVARLTGGENFDVILCDLMMPTMSGMDLYRAVQPTRPDLMRKFIFVTGGACSARAEEFLQVGCAVIAKPFTPASLRAIVSEYTGKAGDSRATRAT